MHVLDLGCGRGVLDVDVADAMPDGWRLSLDRQHLVAPDNTVEIDAVRTDAGRNLGYVRAVGRRSTAPLDEPIISVPVENAATPLLPE